VFTVFPDLDSREVVQSLSDQHWIEFFGNWTNTDKPDHVSDGEWEYRRK